MLIILLHLPNGAEVIQLSYCCRLLLCVMYHPCCFTLKKNSILLHYSARANDYSSICTCCTVVLILIDFTFLIKYTDFNCVVDMHGFVFISISFHLHSISTDNLLRSVLWQYTNKHFARFIISFHILYLSNGLKNLKKSENINLKYALLLILNIMFITENLLIARTGLIYLLSKLSKLIFNFEFTTKLHKCTLEVHLSWLYFTA